MIWIWLWRALVTLLRLFIPPPAAIRGLSGRIDPSGQCPACGNTGLKLKFIRKPDDSNKAYILCTCETCTCQYLENTVGVAKEPWI